MKLNKWLAGLLSLIVVVTAACSNGSGGEAESGEKAADPASSAVTPAAETPAAEETAKGPATGKFDPPVTITTARSIGADITFINGEDVHNNVHNTWAKDKLGIEIKDLWNTADLTAYYTKLRLSLSTAEPLPDVFIVQDTNLIADLIQSGKVRDIQADFDAYAPERIKQVYADNAGALNQVKTDGKLMGLPIFTAGDGTNAVLWIRQDWLDKLNLQAPKTMAEFEQVMDAFVNQDPDGNGKKDTIGFSFSARDGFANWMSDASFIFGSQTGKFIPMLWQEGEDGTLKYGSVQPGIKESLAKLRDWFAKGYLDPEVAALDAMKATESFIQGKSGMIAAPYWANGWPLGDVAASNPNAVVRAYALPTGDDGKAARFSTSLNEGKVMMFSKDFEHMDAFFLYMDKIYDNTFGTGDFKYGFFEGYDYGMEGDKPVYDSTKYPASSNKYNLFWSTPDVPFRESADYDHIFKGGEPQTPKQAAIVGANPETLRAGSLNFEMKSINQPNEYLGAPTPTMRSHGDNLKTMELETFAKIIYGSEPLEKFDQFVADWKSKGGDQIEKEINEWYSSAKQ